MRKKRLTGRFFLIVECNQLSRSGLFVSKMAKLESPEGAARTHSVFMNFGFAPVNKARRASIGWSPRFRQVDK